MIAILLYGVPLLGAFALLLWAVSRKRGPAAAKPVERTPERIQKEKELLDRLDRLKKRADSVSAAVANDPQRAARAVRTMMKDRNDKKS